MKFDRELLSKYIMNLDKFPEVFNNEKMCEFLARAFVYSMSLHYVSSFECITRLAKIVIINVVTKSNIMENNEQQDILNVVNIDYFSKHNTTCGTFTFSNSVEITMMFLDKVYPNFGITHYIYDRKSFCNFTNDLSHIYNLNICTYTLDTAYKIQDIELFYILLNDENIGLIIKDTNKFEIICKAFIENYESFNLSNIYIDALIEQSVEFEMTETTAELLEIKNKIFGYSDDIVL